MRSSQTCTREELYNQFSKTLTDGTICFLLLGADLTNEVEKVQMTSKLSRASDSNSISTSQMWRVNLVTLRSRIKSNLFSQTDYFKPSLTFLTNKNLLFILFIYFNYKFTAFCLKEMIIFVKKSKIVKITSTILDYITTCLTAEQESTSKEDLL